MNPRSLMDGITLFTSALYQTTSTVIESEEAVFVVDPNWLPDEVARIREFVNSRKAESAVILVFTHSDYDHIIGYRAFDGAKVIASSAFVSNPNKAQDVYRAKHFDESHDITRDYDLEYPAVDIEITHDGQTLQFGETKLTFYLAPGHTDQGMFIIFEPQGVFIAGDYLSDIEFPLINGSLSEYRLTMHKVERILDQHPIRQLVPGHGSPTGVRNEIIHRRDQAVEYLDDLEAFVREGIEFPAEKYRSRYAFWDGIRKWHEENILYVLS